MNLIIDTWKCLLKKGVMSHSDAMLDVPDITLCMNCVTCDPVLLDHFVTYYQVLLYFGAVDQSFTLNIRYSRL